MRVFLEENQKLNLSAYREEETCWIGNVLDSVAAVSCFDGACPEGSVSSFGYAQDDSSIQSSRRAQHDTLKVIDIGTGGGFPLLPLAILFPSIEFTGLDSTRKKIDAVQRIIDALQIPNVRLLLGRAEELGHDALHREQYDLVLGRAVASLNTLLELMSPFAKINGKLLCWKSLSIEEELTGSVHAGKQCMCRLSGQHEYALPGDWGKRQILIYEKEKALPQEFPREIGMPKKEPL